MTQVAEIIKPGDVAGAPIKKLGELLVARGCVTGEQVLRAILAQRTSGGRLGTCLLEMELLREEDLLKTLARQQGVPAAQIEHLRAISNDVVGLVPARVAEHCHAVPFDATDKEIDVAMDSAKNLALLDELAFATNRHVRPYVCCEARIFEALGKYYNLEYPRRYARLVDRLNRSLYLWRENESSPGEESFQVVSQAAGGVGAAVSPFANGTEVSWTQLEEAFSALDLPALESRPAPQAPPPAPPAPGLVAPEGDTARLHLDEVDRAFQKSVEPAEIGETGLRYLAQHFRRAALFQVKSGQVKPWLAAGEGLDSGLFRAVLIRLGEPSIFHNLAHGAPFHAGAMPPMPAHRQLVRCWGGAWPDGCVMVPVHLGERLVAVLYGDHGPAGSGPAGSGPAGSGPAGSGLFVPKGRTKPASAYQAILSAMADEETFSQGDKASRPDDEPDAASEATGPDDFDGAWKKMTERFFRPFLQLCHPKAHDDIDWAKGVESLDKDLKKLLPKSETSGRWADKLMKVWRLSHPAKDTKDFVGSEPGIVYMHVEFQNQRDKELPLRVFTTSYRAFDRYQCPVSTLVILGNRGDWDLETSFGWNVWDTKVGIEFPVVKLWEYNKAERWAELEALAETNPFAVLLMAHVKAMATQNKASSRYSWKLRLFRRLLKSGYERHDIEDLLDFVDWLMQLPEPFEERLDKEVEMMEATKRVPYTTPWERRGRKEGQQEGRKEGRQEGLRLGKAELLKSLATQRFGELGDDVVERIDRADVDTLERWSHRLFDAERPEDLFDDEE